MTYKIIGDSCTDLTAEMMQDPHFVKVPLSIQVGPETILDDENFHQGELLQKMRAWPPAPKTAALLLPAEETQSPGWSDLAGLDRRLEREARRYDGGFRLY